MGRTRNLRLEAAVHELGLPQERLAARFRAVAAENGATELAATNQSSITRWIAGTRPSGRAPSILAATLSQGLGRTVTLADIGLADIEDRDPRPPQWSADTLTTLVDLGSTDLDMDRRRVLAGSAYSIAGLAIPTTDWWNKASDRARARTPVATHTVTVQDVESVREMTAFFSRRDQQRGGRGAGRTALVAYLRTDVAQYLAGRFPSEEVRRSMTSAAGELAYVAGWTAFDAGEHSVALHWFTLATQLAEEARDAPLAGHVLRAMAHQAVDLNQPAQAVRLSTASLADNRYTHASWREKALLGVVHARALAAERRRKEAATALLQAERDLGRAQAGDDEPSRVWFFGEASLAHETAAALRDLGDLKGAEAAFERSVRTRALPFARTHAVTLGYLGEVQARQGHLDAAITTWTKALDAMAGIQSARTRQAVESLRSTLSPIKGRGGRTAQELDQRAREFLAHVV
ncbi:Tat pathway signal protein [Streptomyces virginiae]|uniref:Tat pathway signal protein n=1 Tax=Streptomyces virginiae TaxID=1961 RepID=UPI0032500957